VDQDLKYYRRLLGVGPQASAAELRAAFRRRVREVHPDLNPDQPGAALKLQQLQLAYAALSALAQVEAARPPSLSPSPALPPAPPAPEISWRLTGVEAAGLDVVYHLAVAGPGRAVLPHRRDQLCPRCQGRGRRFHWRWARLSFEEIGRASCRERVS
jgi:molecular chaperone DnaJ